MAHLGGTSLFLGQDVGFGHRESMADFGRVLSQYADADRGPGPPPQGGRRSARHCSCSVINGLTDMSHPCQALADLFTLHELVGRLAGQTLAWVGDGNNVARSVAMACGRLGMRFIMATPPAYRFEDDFVAKLRRQCPDMELVTTCNPAEAVADAVAVYTDVWTSMGQEAENRFATGLRRLPGQRRPDGPRVPPGPISSTACRPAAAKR